MSLANLTFALLLHNAGLPKPVSEYKFHESRKWRFDHAWPAQKIALEVEGGIWIKGRHTRGTGFIKDMEKYNNAAALGWRVLRCTPDTLNSTATLEFIQKAINSSHEP